MQIVDLKAVKSYLPRRKKTDNKTAGGKCLIIAGSVTMPGAAILAATAAARVGAGYVYLATDPKIKSRDLLPDFIRLDINKKINYADFASIAIGPGLGRNRNTLKILSDLKKIKFKNVVIDADAITTLASKKSLMPLPSHWVITPHTGELTRILSLKKSILPSERKSNLKKSQKFIGGLLLLKGSPTFVMTGRKAYLIRAGNQALAKAGTGDVLTGMIAGFLAQGVAPLQATLMSAVIHGHIADRWIKSKDYLSLMASDLIAAIPETLFQMRKRN